MNIFDRENICHKFLFDSSSMKMFLYFNIFYEIYFPKGKINSLCIKQWQLVSILHDIHLIMTNINKAFELLSNDKGCVDSWLVVFIPTVQNLFVFCLVTQHKRQSDFIGAIPVKANWPHDALFAHRVLFIDYSLARSIVTAPSTFHLRGKINHPKESLW